MNLKQYWVYLVAFVDFIIGSFFAYRVILMALSSGGGNPYFLQGSIGYLVPILWSYYLVYLTLKFKRKAIRLNMFFSIIILAFSVIGIIDMHEITLMQELFFGAVALYAVVNLMVFNEKTTKEIFVN